jgi:hypothetical protein
MPLDQFTEEAHAGLAQGKDQVAVGTAKSAFNQFEWSRQELFHDMIKAMNGHSK